jgi:hypothetical protein
MREHLRRIPGVKDQGDGLYTFGERDEHGIMEIEMLVVRDRERVPVEDLAAEDAERSNGIEVRIPRPWVMPRGPQVFALVFMMAEWNGWEVYDPQIEDTLQKEAVLSGLVAVRQQQLEREGRGGPPGTRAHFLQPDASGVSAERPQRPGGVKMESTRRRRPEGEEYVPTVQDPPAPEDDTPKKPWWKVWGEE